MTPNAQIEIVNVGFQYVGAEKIALKNISLSIQKGEVVAIVGHNGSGKSTLCKMLNALLLPAEGTVLMTRDRANADYYGRSVTPQQILARQVSPPAGAKFLQNVLMAADSRYCGTGKLACR
ncbi:MAG: ATP-binding cassette domain-containing protein [Alphaproteobacteria bacterium]|nr:ATP-binding cassette domain-containing protein [Alphaproteobacteria bacterium]